MDTITLLSILAFVIILVSLVFIREKSNQRFEVRNPDILLALIIPTIILFSTGKITRFEFGDLSVESAWANAAQAEVKTYITAFNTSLPVSAIKSNAKRGVRDIPKLIQDKTQVLSFVLGQGNYYGPAISEYFNALYKTADFKYILIKEQDGTFWCLADARKLAELNQKGANLLSYNNLTKWLNKSDKTALKDLPGFISNKDAVINTADKINVLTKMEALNIDQLPTIDDQGKFIGVVDRSQILSSLILDVTKRLEGK